MERIRRILPVVRGGRSNRPMRSWCRSVSVLTRVSFASSPDRRLPPETALADRAAVQRRLGLLRCYKCPACARATSLPRTNLPRTTIRRRERNKVALTKGTNAELVTVATISLQKKNRPNAHYRFCKVGCFRRFVRMEIPIVGAIYMDAAGSCRVTGGNAGQGRPVRGAVPRWPPYA